MGSEEARQFAADLRRVKEEAGIDVDGPKELERIDESLEHFYMRPGAPWGFVIFRTVYGPSSDAKWARMLELLREEVAETLELEEEIHLLPRHEVTVIEDEATLNGADSYTVRRAFRAWVAEDLPPRLNDDALGVYGTETQIRAKLRSSQLHSDIGNPAAVAPPRWQYCLWVDENCLRSLSEDGGESIEGPAMKILTTDWDQEEARPPTEEFTTDWDEGETDDPWEGVGWMYMGMSDYATMYERMCAPFFWDDFYQRPRKSWVDQ